MCITKALTPSPLFGTASSEKLGRGLGTRQTMYTFTLSHSSPFSLSPPPIFPPLSPSFPSSTFWLPPTLTTLPSCSPPFPLFFPLCLHSSFPFSFPLLLSPLPSPTPTPLSVHNTALPLYSVTRAFCKDLLRKTFTTLLLPENSQEGSDDLRRGELTSDTFKYILNLAKEANSSLLAYHSDVRSLSAAARSSDSGA